MRGAGQRTDETMDQWRERTNRAYQKQERIEMVKCQAIQCPTCPAEAGEVCRNGGGRKAWGKPNRKGWAHQDRVSMWKRSDAAALEIQRVVEAQSAIMEAAGNVALLVQVAPEDATLEGLALLKACQVYDAAWRVAFTVDEGTPAATLDP